MSRTIFFVVMRGLDPRIHWAAKQTDPPEARMAGPGMTEGN